MTALYIILGIILFFLLILSIKVKVTVHSEDGVSLAVGWLFLKFDILPKKEKAKKKKKKKEKKKKTDTADESADKPVKEPKDNPFLTFYHNNGVDGVIDLLKRLGVSLGGMFKRVYRAFTVEDIAVSLLVGAGDSAETAMKYGKTCAMFYPVMGFVVDNMRVKKYSAEVNPDFINGSNKARVHAVISVIPRRLINAVIIVAFSLIFRVGIKFLKGLKKKNSPEENIKPGKSNSAVQTGAAD